MFIIIMNSTVGIVVNDYRRLDREQFSLMKV